MFKFKFLKYNEAGDGDGSAGAPPAKNETPPPAQKDAPNTPPPQEGGNTDEFGYAKAPADDKSGEKGDGEKKEGAKTPSKDDEKIPEDAVAGYGDKAPEVPDAGKQDDPPKKKEDDGLGYELEVKDLDEKEVQAIKDLAKEMKLTKEQAQTFVEIKKKELVDMKASQDAYEKQVQVEVTKQKAAWHNELKTDPDFGGEKFAHSVAKVEKFISEFMTDTKKVLTERKSMLPPYVMKDILRAANKFYDTEKLVTGSGASDRNSSKEEKEVSPLDFYT